MNSFKKILLLLMLGLFAVSCKNDNSKFDTLITEKIQYDIKINNNDVDLDWWIQNIEGSKREKFINMIFDAVKDNNLKIYDLSNNPTSIENVFSKFISFDTIKLQNGSKKQMLDTILISNSLDLKNITQLRFREKWVFNEKTLLVNKQVQAYCPLILTYIPDNDTSYTTPLFWIFPDSITKSDNSKLTQITPKIQYDVIIKSAEKGKDWFENNIETTERESFINKILDVASKGKLKVFDFFDQPLNKDKFKELLHKTDTIEVENPDDPGNFSKKVIKTDIDAKSIVKIRFIEEWEIDPLTFNFYKKVKAISLLMEVKDDRGEIRGFTPLFWVYFDDTIKPNEKN